ncbi:MAG: hypothetical protein KC543_15615 [Myxococcales bacterium]|nr:hypothetical protein [Myxococcales bacterium]
MDTHHARLLGGRREVVVFVAALWVAQIAGAATARAQERPVELRFTVPGVLRGWSHARARHSDAGEEPIYLDAALGVRVFPHGPHGLLLDYEARWIPPLNWLAIDLGPPSSAEWDSHTVHVGCAYRWVVYDHRRPERHLAFAITPHASVAVGAALVDPDSCPEPCLKEAKRWSPLVGARVGVDADMHFGRFLMGSTLTYELRAPTRGPVAYTHFVGWKAVPFIRAGVVLGPLPEPRITPAAH